MATELFTASFWIVKCSCANSEGERREGRLNPEDRALGLAEGIAPPAGP